MAKQNEKTKQSIDPDIKEWLMKIALELTKAQTAISGVGKNAGETFKEIYHDVLEVYNE